MTEDPQYPRCDKCGKLFNPKETAIVNNPSRTTCVNCIKYGAPKLSQMTKDLKQHINL